MSYANYEKAMGLAKTKKGYECYGEMPDDFVKQVEERLGVNLSKQHYDYYKNYGDICFYGSEFYGIHPKVLESTYSVCDNVVTTALRGRAEEGLPHNWLPLYDYGDSEEAYADYDTLNAEGEPRIVVGHYNPEGYEMLEVVAEDIGDFILEIVGWNLD